MNKAYTRINWENEPSFNTPINEENLNTMDVAINELDDRIVGLDTSKSNESEVLSLISDVSFDESTGTFTFTRKNGSTIKFDTKLEKIIVNFVFNHQTQTLDITLEDGTVQQIDLSALVTQYDFLDSDTIRCELKVENVYDESTFEHEIDYRNYGLPDVYYPNASEHIGKYYLDLSTGIVYNSKLANRSETEYVWSTIRLQLTLLSSNYKVVFHVVDGSITEDKINPDFLSELKLQNEYASENATLSKSYAIGGTGTRQNEDFDNSKYYYEQAKEISLEIGGSLIPKGTIKSSEISLVEKQIGYMYIVSDGFVSDNTFKDGGGVNYPAGTKIYWTSDGLWDCLSTYDYEKNSFFGICMTRNEPNKVITVNNDFVLKYGYAVTVQFVFEDKEYAEITLNVNDTGAKPIYWNNKPLTTTYISEGSIYTFIYDGTYWRLTSVPVYGIKDSESSDYLLSKTKNIVTERFLYNSFPNFNGIKPNNSYNFYVPSSTGEKGQFLKSNGNGEPVWSDIEVGSSKKKYIFVGDSYSIWKNNTGWIKELVTFMGLSSDDYYNAGVSGTSFVPPGTMPSFQNNLENVVTSDDSLITDIVVCGGYNDANNDLATGSAIASAIINFCTYAKSRFPNANVWVGFIGNDANLTTEGSKVRDKCAETLFAYKSCNQYGATYLTGVEYANMAFNYFDTDGIHPGDTAKIYIAAAIKQALESGCNESFYVQRELSLVNSEATMSGHLYERFSNGSAKIYTPGIGIKYTTAKSLVSGLNKMGDIDSNYFRDSNYNSFLVNSLCLIETSSGQEYITLTVQFYMGGMYIYLPKYISSVTKITLYFSGEFKQF